jgi:hypothetical protein
MDNVITQSWYIIYASCAKLLKDKSNLEKMRFYSSKPTSLLDKFYLIAIEKQDLDAAGIIFEILRER